MMRRAIVFAVVAAGCARGPAPTAKGFLVHRNFEGAGDDRKRFEGNFTKLEGSLEFVVRAEVFTKHVRDKNPFVAASVEMTRNDRGAKVDCALADAKLILGSISANGTSRGEHWELPVVCKYEWRGACGAYATDSGIPVRMLDDGTIDRD
jgi:hypothetical protein